MEFPNLGKHCSEEFCNKLDFLPMKCDACGAIFCSDHFSYKDHACPSAYKKDVQVPICPLCGDPVPTPRDVSPDVTVGAHIDRFCKSDRKKIYTNRCSYRNCKKKELIPVNCSVCRLNFCLKHRHTTDHDCQGSEAGQRNLVATAAIQRQTAKPVSSGGPFAAFRSSVSSSSSVVRTHNTTTNEHIAIVQGGMSEDEALARAIALSMQEEEQQQTQLRQSQQERNPSNTARRIAVGNGSGTGTTKDRCNLS
ncbi:AN1-type zinc finger protein 2A [Anopheles maculipalpis]|uniref:AN1-type zinc finger protein 2A n=1 Tax=Anopheles maculipalpis TaxID=1496333 RepID=UPI0021592B45|nr:AN1-type zinc finger protein 2A [Anopheles maculipalpis]